MVEPAVLRAADPVLDAGVRPVAGFDLGELPARRVGGEGLESPAVVVGESQLRAGMRPFPPHDHPLPRRPAGAGQLRQQPGEFGDVRAFTQTAVGFDRRGPRRRRQAADRLLHGLGHGEPDRKPQVHALFTLRAQMCQPFLGGAGAVRADQDRSAVPVLIGDLRQRQVGHRDVVGGRVAPARPVRCTAARGSLVLSSHTVSG